MDCLPEQDEVEEYREEPGQEGGAPRRSGSFVTGFLAGILAASFCVFLFVTGWNLGDRFSHTEQPEPNGAEVLTANETLRKLDEVQSLIEENYLGEIDSQLLSDYLFKGVAAGLDDVYANYYSEEELTSVMDLSRGAYTGIGAVFSQDRSTGTVTVEELYENMPAELGGMQVGDQLLAINGETVEGRTLDEIVAQIKYQEETFEFTVRRPGTDEELTLSVTCGEVEVTTVTYELLPDGIGYIQILEFTEKAVEQFIEAAEALQTQGMQSLIVDLRGNPGGLLTSVCGILDEVLPEKLLVYTEDRNGRREEYYSDRKRTLDCEIAVLVNKDSASASEIFAGAIQDYGVGPVIGTQTFGKGVVQKTFTLSDGSGFKMTAEKYFTPLGQDIDGNGITPDIVVEEVSESEEAKTGVSREREPEETEDPVLLRAIEELRK